MAKKDKKAEKETKAEAAEFKYVVQDLADELGIKPASVRVQLRNHGIEKAGKAYGWNTKKELQEVIDQIRSGSDEDDDEDEAPKKKSKSKKDKAPKSEKKSKSKKPAKKSKDEDEDDDEDDE